MAHTEAERQRIIRRRRRQRAMANTGSRYRRVDGPMGGRRWERSPMQGHGPACSAELSAGRDLPADVARGRAMERDPRPARRPRRRSRPSSSRSGSRARRPDEVAGLVDAMLAAAAPLDLADPDGTVDLVGTGGATPLRGRAFNVSTMASLVAAAPGATVCKHGNRKASSTSGSTDLLEALGVEVELDGPRVARCVDEAGVGFAFARMFHPAMRHAAPVRAELGIPTVFNVLGPLSHPGRVGRQVLGVSDPRLLDLVPAVLRPSRHRPARGSCTAPTGSTSSRPPTRRP